MERTALPNLTSLRFFAAMMVFLYHTAHLFPWPHWPWLSTLLGSGFSGVSLFFVLSGFLLAYNHQTVPSPGRFYLLRFARIYPLYLFAFLCSLPFAFHQLGPRLTTVAGITDLLLLQTWFPSLVDRINTPAWTLSVEAFFYALFPLLLAPLSRIRRQSLAIALLWLLAITPGLLLHHAIPARTIPALSPLLHTPPFRLCEFLLGMLLGIRYRRQPTHTANPTPALAALALSLAILFTRPFWPLESFRDGLLALPFGLLIYALAGLRSRLLTTPFLQLAGESSYAFYLLQLPFFRAL